MRDHLGCHVFPILDPSLAAAKKEKEKDVDLGVSISEDEEEVVVRKKTTKKRTGTGPAPKGLAATCNKLTQILEAIQVCSFLFYFSGNFTDLNRSSFRTETLPMPSFSI